MPGPAPYIRINLARRRLMLALEKIGRPVEEDASLEKVVKAAAQTIEEAAS